MKTNLRLLITGFGPFPGVDDNPSGRLARTLDGTTFAGVRLSGRILDTHWLLAWPQLQTAVAALQPSALIMLGVASRDRVEVERIAYNQAAPRVDCAGALPADAVLVPDGPATLSTRLPWDRLDAATSDDAGRYLCNAIFYRALHGLTLPCGFVHMPPEGGETARALIQRYARLLGSGQAAPSRGISCS
jgi:pyroglutamyl-peptidase